MKELERLLFNLKSRCSNLSGAVAESETQLRVATAKLRECEEITREVEKEVEAAKKDAEKSNLS